MFQPLIYRAFRLVQSHGRSLIGGLPSQNEHLEFVILEAHADRIPRAMPYCFQGSMRLSCCKLALFAMCMVSLNYIDSGNCEKHEWCREVIRHIATCGFDIASHLCELTSYQWERQWVAADPLTCISLRQTDSPVCSSKPLAVSEISECRDERTHIHYGDELVLDRWTTLDWVPLLTNSFGNFVIMYVLYPFFLPRTSFWSGDFLEMPLLECEYYCYSSTWQGLYLRQYRQP